MTPPLRDAAASLRAVVRIAGGPSCGVFRRGRASVDGIVRSPCNQVSNRDPYRCESFARAAGSTRITTVLRVLV